MGCSNGKMVNVLPVNSETSALPKDRMTGNNSGFKQNVTGSCASIDGGERPSGSATSKVSKRSLDSGYDGNELDGDDDTKSNVNEYANMITENSDCAIVEEIEKNFKPFEFDFCLNGTPAPRNLSAKDKARLDEQRILENLRNEGLIATSKFEAKSGLAFEVVEATTLPRRAIPARLAKLDKRKKKKKTKEEIANKLAKAEQRRKEAELEKLEKINSVSTKSDVVNIQQDQVKQQQELLEHTIQKVDQVAENRELKLQAIKDKLKARQEHAAKVRLRKKLHIPTTEELDEFEKKNLSDQLLLKSSCEISAESQAPPTDNDLAHDPPVHSDNEEESVPPLNLATLSSNEFPVE